MTPAAEGRRAARAPLAALAAIVVVGFLLRLSRVDESLAGDEFFTLRIIRKPLGQVWHEVYTTSVTPPLHYYLAWASIRLGGDPTEMLRLPSLVLGTALIVLVFLLGRRIAGPWAGVAGATIYALDPFGLYYGSEGRAYTTMAFFVLASVLALDAGLRGRGRRWFALAAVAGCAALWSHYTSVFVLGGALAWALWARPAHRRATLLTGVAVAVGYAPWIPGFLAQRSNHLGIGVIEGLGPLTPTAPLALPLRSVVGMADVDLRTIPGVWGIPLLAVAVALVAAAVVLARRSGGGRVDLRALARGPVGLTAIAAVATVLGLVLYAAAGTPLFLVRNVSASAAPLAALLGAVVWVAARRVPRPAAAVALAALAALLVVDSARSLEVVHRRPPFREAAAYIDARSRPGDLVVEVTLTPRDDPKSPPTTMDLYLKRRERVLRVDDGSVLRDALTRRSGWLVTPGILARAGAREAPGLPAPPADLTRRRRAIGGADGRLRLGRSVTVRGGQDVIVTRLLGLVTGRVVPAAGGGAQLRWTEGTARLVPGALSGRVDVASGTRGRQATLTGWAAADGRPADWVVLLAGDRLIGVSAGGLPRADVARSLGRPDALRSGFALIAPVPAGVGVDDLRVLAVSGDRASVVPLGATARTALSTALG